MAYTLINEEEQYLKEQYGWLPTTEVVDFKPEMCEEFPMVCKRLAQFDYTKFTRIKESLSQAINVKRKPVDQQ